MWQQRALSKVKALSQSHNVPIHGTILELIEPIPQLYLATEVCSAVNTVFQMSCDLLHSIRLKSLLEDMDHASPACVSREASLA